MSGTAVPRERFRALVERLGGRADTTALAEALEMAWGEPHRVYHGLDHLHDCLGQLDEAAADRAEGADRDLAEAALWFHDAVYDPRASDNEARSAEWAERALTQAGVPDARAKEVARLVLLTRHTTPAIDPTGALVCDADLAVLGRPPADYAAYERRIRAEYEWVPEPVFRAERARILRGLLARPSLYATDHFRRLHEARARENLSHAVARLAGS